MLFAFLPTSGTASLAEGARCATTTTTLSAHLRDAGAARDGIGCDLVASGRADRCPADCADGPLAADPEPIRLPEPALPLDGAIREPPPGDGGEGHPPHPGPLGAPDIGRGGDIAIGGQRVRRPPEPPPMVPQARRQEGHRSCWDPDGVNPVDHQLWSAS